MKMCSACKEAKLVSEFCRNKSRSDGMNPYCKECMKARHRVWRKKNPEKIAAYGRARKKRNPTDRRVRLLKQYGLDKAIYSKMGNACWICGGLEPGYGKGNFHIDHDHACCPGIGSCGRCIRGLLCAACNTSLGGFRDDPKLLRKAADYLEGGYYVWLRSSMVRTQLVPTTLPCLMDCNMLAILPVRAA